MAFNKRIWKGRQGTGLNKFSINGATPVTVINQPDSVTEQGDALSAGNLNDLEGRIYTAFEDEATARANADSDLKDAIDGMNARVENLEQEHGGYVPVNYRGTNDVPTNKAKYALVESIVGKTRGNNQLINDGDFRNTGRLTSYGGTVSYDSSGVTGVLPAGIYYNQAYYKNLGTSIPSGHTVLVVLIGSATTMRLYHDNTIVGEPVSINNAVIIPNISGLANQLRWGPSSIAEETTYKWSYVLVRDLTLIFPDLTSAEITSLGVAGLVKLCPDLLKYDAYGSSIVDTTVEGVKSVGVNLLDNSIFDSTSNFPTFYNNYYYADVIQLKPYTEYNVSSFLTGTSQSGLYGILLCPYNGFGYSPASLYINNGASASQTITTGANGQIRIGVMQPTSYIEKIKGNYDIQICDNSLPDAIKTEYHAYMTSTLSLPSSVTLKSVSTWHDTYTLESGKKNRIISNEIVIDGSDDEGWYKSSTVFISDGISVTDAYSTNWWAASLAKTGLASSVVCADYNEYENLSSALTLVSGKIRLHITACENMTEAEFKTWLGSNNITFQYVLASAVESDLDPVLDNLIATEGGGTINTIQTQTPVIDNCLDVGYLAL